MINFNFDGLNLGCIKNSILKWKKVQEVEYYSKVKFINIYLLKMKMKMKRVGGGGGGMWSVLVQWCVVVCPSQNWQEKIHNVDCGSVGGVQVFGHLSCQTHQFYGPCYLHLVRQPLLVIKYQFRIVYNYYRWQVIITWVKDTYILVYIIIICVWIKHSKH